MVTFKELLLVLAFAVILVGAIFIGVNYLLQQDYTTTSSGQINVDADELVIQLDDKNNATLNKYIEQYDDTALGYAAYILNRIQVYSIPVCVILFVIGAFLYWVVSAKKFVEAEKGYGYIVSSIIFLAIAQIAPLVFALIATIGRG